MKAAAVLTRRGVFAMQGEEATLGLRLWARHQDVDLELVDDPAPYSLTEVYHRWLSEERVDLVLGPYGSGQVRRILPAVDGVGKVLWNHGGSADDLARPGVVPVVAPASTYLVDTVRYCGRLGINSLAIVVGKGPFAALVARGARDEARRRGIETELVIGAERLRPRDPGGAVLVTAGFQEDVMLVERIRAGGGPQPALLGCVAAGVPQFGERLGPFAEGVIGPTQWIPRSTVPEVGPSGVRFRQMYLDAYGHPPGYVAAQAATAGYLAAEACRRGMEREDLLAWNTFTMLGGFALDAGWRQVGYTVSTIRWRDGEMEAIPSLSES